MKLSTRLLLPLALLCVTGAAGFATHAQQTVTLHAPHDRETGKYSERRSWFSFEFGVVGKADRGAAGDQWDIGYGFLNVNGEDFIQVAHGREDRGVIKDLGALTWADDFEVPVLAPLPVVPEGQQRVIGVNASAGKADHWSRTNGVFAKAVVGHIYAVRVKDDDSDFYALFRVESIEQGRSCTISWRLASAPGP